MEKFKSLTEFRQLSQFKTLNPYIRKCIINICNFFPETIICCSNNKIFFENPILSSYIKYNDVKSKTYQDSTLFKLLDKIKHYNYCITSHGEFISLYRFTLVKSQRKPLFIYHTTNTPPNIILQEGIKRYYSMGVKAFPPLVFVGTEPVWYGNYTYKIQNKVKDLFIDTNLDHRQLDKRPYLCTWENISPDDIVDYTINTFE